MGIGNFRLRIANLGRGRRGRIKIKRGGGEAFEDPADGEVVFAGEVDAGEELGALGVAREGGDGRDSREERSVARLDSQVSIRS